MHFSCTKKQLFMKKVLLLLCFWATIIGFAQTEKKDAGCGSDQLHLNLLARDPEYKARFEKNNTQYEQWAKAKLDKTKKRATNRSIADANNTDTYSTVNLKVVFHNMTTSSTTSQTFNNSFYDNLIVNLNTYFSASVSNPSTSVSTPAIHFCLAQQDAQGNSYSDAARNYSVNPLIYHEIKTTDNVETIGLSSVNNGILLTRFPKNQYINIYLVDGFEDPILRGCSYLPSAHGQVFDGIYIQRDALTSNDNGTLTTLAHEMGHYLGLFHIFGICDPGFLGGNPPSPYNVTCSCNGYYDPNDNTTLIPSLSEGDKVSDTPPQQMVMNSNCYSTINTCTGDNISDLKHNFMDYVDYLACRNSFTVGQVDRMQFMLNPVSGARNSLLSGIALCNNCAAMNYFQPVITPNTPTVFSASFVNSININQTFTGNVTYSWSLQFLDGAILPAAIPGAGLQFDLGNIASVANGNYSLTLTATIATGCYKTTTFLFSVVPTNTNNCNLILPSITYTNSIKSIDWGNWNRVYYKGGWSRATTATNSPYNFATTERTTNQNIPTATDGDNGFDFINLSDFHPTNGAPSYDSNFDLPAIYTNSSLSNIKLLRVGKKITGSANLEDGAAYYVNYTFQPTSENCKYRIWYLGFSNLAANGVAPQYQNFNINQGGVTSYGVLSRYQYNSSTILNNGSLTPTTLGMTENGVFIDNGSGGFKTYRAGMFGLNDMVYNKLHSTFSAVEYDNVTIGLSNYSRSLVWKYYDLDFSEFVNTPGQGSSINTQVTLTFFARTNDASGAKSHSYAYFGIECKGGGVPADYTLNFPNIQLPCQAPTIKNCAYTINLPHPKYALDRPADNGNSYFSWINPNLTDIYTYNNLSTLAVAAFSDAAATLPLTSNNTINVNTIQSDNHYTDYQLKLCNTLPASTSIYYKVTFKTLHKTLESVFRVTNGYTSNTPPCPERLGTIDTQNASYLVCNNSSQIQLAYNPTSYCSNELVIPGIPKYKWKMKTCTDATCSVLTEDTEIPDAVGATLDVLPSKLTNCRTYFTRYTEYNDPFCGKTYFPEATFTVNNTSSFSVSTSTTTPTDICINGIFKLTVSNFKLSLPSCSLPTGSEAFSSTNNVTFDLVGSMTSPQSLINLPYTTKTINYATLTNAIQPNFDLSFNNNPAPSVYIFNSNGSFTIYLKITYNILGCTNKVEYKPIVFNIINSAAPGIIVKGIINCSTFSINSTNLGTTTPTGFYGWEYSLNPTFSDPHPLPIPSIPNYVINQATLINYPFLSIPYNALPFYIRRVSYGMNTCADPNTYTAAIAITNIPSFGDNINLCKTSVSNLALSMPELNGVSGSWNYSNFPNSVNTTTVYSSTNHPDLTNAITFTVDNGSGVCLTPITQQPNITLNVTPAITTLPALPATSSQTVCDGTTFSQLIPTNSSVAGCIIKWYQYSGGNSNPFDSSIQIPQSYTYYPANINTTTGCRGDKSGVVVTVTPKTTPTFLPVAPICPGNTSNTLPTISTNNYTGTWLPPLNNTVTTTYTFTPNTGQCANNGTMSITVINTDAPTSISQTLCTGATVANLTATGTGIKWYSSATGGYILASTTALNTGHYYASQTLNGCESSTRADVLITINTTAAPTILAQTLCGGTTVANLATNGYSVNWYAANTSGVALASTVPIATGTYYASQTLIGCESTRTPVAVTVNATPISAANDIFTGTVIDTTAGGSSASVFVGDAINGVQPTALTVSVAIAPTPNISITPDGELHVAPNTPADNYIISYTITEIGCTTNTATATATIVVGTASIPIACSGPLLYINCYDTIDYTSASLLDDTASNTYDHGAGVTIYGVSATAATTYLIPDPSFTFPSWFHLLPDGNHFTLDANAPLGNNYFYCKFCMTNAPGVCTPTVQLNLNIMGLSAFHGGAPTFTNDVYLNDSGLLPDGTKFNVLDLIEKCAGGIHPSISEVYLTQTYPITVNNNIRIKIATGEIFSPSGVVGNGVYEMRFHVCLQNNQNNCVDNLVFVHVGGTNRMVNTSNTNELDPLNVIIAPNPSDSIFNINLGEIPTEKVILEVYNPVGQKVYNDNMTNEQTHELQLNTLSSGTYILKITYKDQVIKKMLIKH